ncbi:MAG: protein TolR [Candidatus Eutrophobiaceae bacterium]
MSEINVVPYIDVMLVLLIIFMVTAPLLNQGVKVELPQAQATPLPMDNEPPIIVRIDKGGLFYLNRSKTPKTALTSNALLNSINALLDEKPNSPVYVGGDNEVAYGRVIRVMALLQQAGVGQVGMITDPPHAEGESSENLHTPK